VQRHAAPPELQRGGGRRHRGQEQDRVVVAHVVGEDGIAGEEAGRRERSVGGSPWPPPLAATHRAAAAVLRREREVAVEVEGREGISGEMGGGVGGRGGGAMEEVTRVSHTKPYWRKVK